jgi:hypothetical protein
MRNFSVVWEIQDLVMVRVSNTAPQSKEFYKPKPPHRFGIWDLGFSNLDLWSTFGGSIYLKSIEQSDTTNRQSKIAPESLGDGIIAE